jgi:hypothetical protein
MLLSVCCVRRYRRLHRRMASEGVTVPQIVESSDGIGAAKAAIAQHEHDDPPGWIDVQVSPTTAAFADSLGMTVNNVVKIARIAEFIPR